MLKVANVAENSFIFNIKGSNDTITKQIVIIGKHKSAVFAPYALTAMSEDDWNSINVQYGHMSELKRKIIFVEKNEMMTKARAEDPEVQAVKTGTQKLTAKDLNPGIKVVPAEEL